MSAPHSLRSFSPIKIVFGKIGDTYHAYCNTYKTHAMDTHYGGSKNPLDRDIDMIRETQKTADTNIKDTQVFNTEDVKYNNPAKLTAVTRQVDDLCQ